MQVSVLKAIRNQAAKQVSCQCHQGERHQSKQKISKQASKQQSNKAPNHPTVGWTGRRLDSRFGWHGERGRAGKATWRHSIWLDVLPDKRLSSIGATQQFAEATDSALGWTSRKSDRRAKRLSNAAFDWTFFRTSSSALEPLSNLLEPLSTWLDKRAKQQAGKATWQHSIWLDALPDKQLSAGAT
jgi:hypothetical protein